MQDEQNLRDILGEVKINSEMTFFMNESVLADQQ